MSKCYFCGHEGEWPYVCMNTRDVEDFAMDGRDRCWEALCKIGGAEKGFRYVELNRKRVKRERAAAHARAEEG